DGLALESPQVKAVVEQALLRAARIERIWQMALFRDTGGGAVSQEFKVLGQRHFGHEAQPPPVGEPAETETDTLLDLGRGHATKPVRLGEDAAHPYDFAEHHRSRSRKCRPGGLNRGQPRSDAD